MRQRSYVSLWRLFISCFEGQLSIVSQGQGMIMFCVLVLIDRALCKAFVLFLYVVVVTYLILRRY